MPLVQVQQGEPTNWNQKDIMPANGFTEPLAGINLLKNRIHGPQIFSTRKWTWTLTLQNFLGWNWIFWQNCLWIISRSREIIHRLFCYVELLPQKYRRDSNLFRNKILSVETVQIAHIISIQTWAPVSCFSNYGKRFTAPFFVFRHNSER